MTKRIKKIILRNASIWINRYPCIYKLVKTIIPQIRVYDIASLYKYVHLNNYIIREISDAVNREYGKPASTIDEYETWDYKVNIVRSCTRQYVSLINNAIIRGDTDGIIHGDLYLTDKVDFDEKGMCEHPPSGAFINNGRILIYEKTNRPKRRYTNAICLVKMWSYNYFHFVIEGLSRLGSVEHLEEYKDWPIVLDECVKEDDRNLDIINLLNINNRKIIWIKKGEQIRITNLLIPACMSWAIWDIKKSVNKGWGYMIAKDAGHYLRDTILSRYEPKKSFDCVYVARGNNKRLTNETQVIDKFKKAGFAIFYPDKAKTFDEEVDCFSTAKCIVLCAGGASTNLVFCNKDVDIFCILPFKYRSDSAQDITQTIGVTVKLRDAVIEEDKGFLMPSKFHFPLDKCQEIIEYCKQKHYLPDSAREINSVESSLQS